MDDDVYEPFGNIGIVPNVIGAQLRNPFDFIDDEVMKVNNSMEKTTALKEALKKRHLTKEERDILHRPVSDYVQSKTGEVCKNACSLPIEDIISKHKLVK